ncbi:MAG: efflux RND transporter permease subunit [Gammaproteobacteria bacterium]|jgi:multidrug efflux pump subunit AcrB
MADEQDKDKDKAQTTSAGDEASDDVVPGVPDTDDHQQHELGIAGTIAKSFINSPVTPMLLIASLLIGVMGLIFTPRQEDPKISVPMIDLYVSYPGASVYQVESLVTDPLERLMDEIPGVRHTYSATERGRAVVTVRFYVGEDLGESIVKVHDKIRSNMDKVPPDVQMPLVKPIAIDDVPTVSVTLWSKEVDDSTLRILANDVLQELGQVKNTGKGFVVGGRADQIRIEVLPERLAGYNISLQQVANTVRTANSESNVGAVEAGSTSFTVYSGTFLKTADAIKRLVVGTFNGAPIYMRDVANVFHGPEDAEQVSYFYAGPAYEGEYKASGDAAVTVAIAKKEDTNGVTVSRDILKKVEELKGKLIPDNVHVEITRDYGKTANDKVNELLQAMFEAAAIVAVLCLVGLGARAAFVVITVIPVVILLTIWWAMIVDYTIDRVSLFALIFSIGILVDDATVVVENIFRHWLMKGRTTITDAVDAVREVGNPTILATFTIIAALLPMGFVSGLMGPYMRPIPVLGSSAMFFSLIAAFIFTPWFALKVRPRLSALEAAERREQRTHRIIGKFYRPIIMPLVESRKLGIIFLISIIAVTAATCLLFYPTQWVPVKMLPFDNKPEFSVIINMPEGTAMPVTANVAHELAEAVKTIPEVTAVQSYAGTAQPFNFNGMVRHYYLRSKPWEGDLLVMLKDKNERERGSHAIAVEARSILTPLAERLGARIAVVEMPPGPPVLQTLVAEIHGPDEKTRREVARKMTEFFEQAEGVVDVDNYMTEPSNYWRFEINVDKAARRGISVESINSSLAMAMGGYHLGDVKLASVIEPTFIVIQVPLATRSQVSQLSNLPVISTAGHSVPLGELGDFVLQPEEPIIYHKDLRAIEYVVGEMEGRLGAPIYGMFNVEEFTDEYTTPDGVIMEGMPMNLIGPPSDDNVSGFEWTGEWTVTFETFRDMGIAFMAALVLIYGLIVWEFRDFAIAGLIMSPIPCTMIGIVPGHWIMGAEFTATSMIGMIALGGIIVRQSILIVEFVKIEVAKGRPVREAAVAGAEIRMRPIMITSLTLMAGAWAIISDPIFQGMAVSLLFGAGVATLMAVLIIPLGCISVRKRFYLEEAGDSADMVLSSRYEEIEGETVEAVEEQVAEYKTPLWMRIYSGVIGLFGWIFLILRSVFIMLKMAVGAILGKFGGSDEPPSPPPASTPPSSPPPAPDSGDSAAAVEKPKEEKAEVEENTKSQATAEPEGEAEVRQTAAAGKKASQKKETAPVEKAAAVKKASPKVKRAPAKKPAASKVEAEEAKPEVKETRVEESQPAEETEATRKPAPAKKAPSKKTSPHGRRGIRLKVDND